MDVAFPNAHYKQLKHTAHAEQHLLWTETENTVLLHASYQTTYIYITTSQPLGFDDRTNPYHILATMHCQNTYIKKINKKKVLGNWQVTHIWCFEPCLTR